MSRIFSVVVLLILCMAIGCESSKAPAPLEMTPELEARIKAEDAQVHAAESAQAKTK
jgi:uncharacterized protein YcfL